MNDGYDFTGQQQDNHCWLTFRGQNRKITGQDGAIVYLYSPSRLESFGNVLAVSGMECIAVDLSEVDWEAYRRAAVLKMEVEYGYEEA